MTASVSRTPRARNSTIMKLNFTIRKHLTVPDSAVKVTCLAYDRRNIPLGRNVEIWIVLAVAHLIHNMLVYTWRSIVLLVILLVFGWNAIHDGSKRMVNS